MYNALNHNKQVPQICKVSTIVVNRLPAVHGMILYHESYPRVYLLICLSRGLRWQQLSCSAPQVWGRFHLLQGKTISSFYFSDFEKLQNILYGRPSTKTLLRLLSKNGIHVQTGLHIFPVNFFFFCHLREKKHNQVVVLSTQFPSFKLGRTGARFSALDVYRAKRLYLLPLSFCALVHDTMLHNSQM